MSPVSSIRNAVSFALESPATSIGWRRKPEIEELITLAHALTQLADGSPSVSFMYMRCDLYGAGARLASV